MKKVTVGSCEIRILGQDDFLKTFECSDREKELIKAVNLPCATTREKGNLVLYARNDVTGPVLETYYTQMYEDLRAEGLKREAIDLIWKQIRSDVVGN